MCKRIALLVALLSCLPFASSFAKLQKPQEPDYTRNNQWGLQAAVTTNGNVGLGIVTYGHYYEAGLVLAGNFISAPTNTSLFTPVVFFGGRKFLAEKTVFAYGLDVSAAYGRISGANIKSSYGVGPYVSIEQYLTQHVLLTAWINPYYYSYQNRSNGTTTTNSIFSSGGVGLSYIF